MALVTSYIYKLIDFIKNCVSDNQLTHSVQYIYIHINHGLVTLLILGYNRQLVS